MTTQAAAAKSAADVCRLFALSAPAGKLLVPDLSPEEFAARLIEQSLYADAVRLFAFALPTRDAVWWACLCLWEHYRPEPAPAVAELLQAVVDWLKAPTDPNRRRAELACQRVPPDSPASQLGFAVYASGGSMAPASLPCVAPPPHLSAKMTAGAILLAAYLKAPHEADYQRRFLALAGDVFSERTPCPSAEPAPSPRR